MPFIQSRRSSSSEWFSRTGAQVGVSGFDAQGNPIISVYYINGSGNEIWIATSRRARPRSLAFTIPRTAAPPGSPPTASRSPTAKGSGSRATTRVTGTTRPPLPSTSLAMVSTGCPASAASWPVAASRQSRRSQAPSPLQPYGLGEDPAGGHRPIRSGQAHDDGQRRPARSRSTAFG